MFDNYSLLSPGTDSVLRSRFQDRHATLLPLLRRRMVLKTLRRVCYLDKKLCHFVVVIEVSRGDEKQEHNFEIYHSLK